MKKIFEEFKKFAFKGNVVDMAVAVVVGAAFSAIVTSLVNDIISPLIGTLVNMDFSSLTAKVNGVDIAYGSFIMAVLNFFIIAFSMFMFVKSINKVTGMGKKKEAGPPTTKKCPFCFSEIHIDATRCPHCTSEIIKKD